MKDNVLSFCRYLECSHKKMTGGDGGDRQYILASSYRCISKGNCEQKSWRGPSFFSRPFRCFSSSWVSTRKHQVFYFLLSRGTRAKWQCGKLLLWYTEGFLCPLGGCFVIGTPKECSYAQSPCRVYFCFTPVCYANHINNSFRGWLKRKGK